jgi:hypothetical protein
MLAGGRRVAIRSTCGSTIPPIDSSLVVLLGRKCSCAAAGLTLLESSVGTINLHSITAGISFACSRFARFGARMVGLELILWTIPLARPVFLTAGFASWAELVT